MTDPTTNPENYERTILIDDEPKHRADIEGKTLDAEGKPTSKTAPKVIASSAGGSVGVALSVLVIWVIEQTTKVDLPIPVEGSISVVFVAAFGWLAGYIKKP